MALAEENPATSGPKYSQGGGPKLVYIVVLNYNGAQTTLDCVRSVLNLDYPNFRVLVVDNASTDGSVAQFKEALTDPRVELLLNDENEGYAGGNNRGVERALAAEADYIFVLNNDTTVELGCLARLVEAMEEDSGLGIAGCPVRDFYLDAPPVYSWHVNLFTMRTAGSRDGLEQQLDESNFISGAAFLIRAEAARRTRMFDARFFLEWEDLDLSFRTRCAGYKLKTVRSPAVRHLGGHTARRYRSLRAFHYFRNRVWVVRRHGKLSHRILFDLYSICYFYPRVILGRLRHREFNLLAPTLQGIWRGHSAYPGHYPGSAG
jgi:GT2 family glycosyltransferase